MAFTNIRVRGAAVEQPIVDFTPELTLIEQVRAFDEEGKRSVLNAAYKIGKDLGRRFEAQDMAPELRLAAGIFADRYEGDFLYMLEMRATLRERSTLSDNQAKGVLNCLMAEARNTLRQRQAAANAVSTPATTAVAPVVDGTYTVAFSDGSHRTFRLNTLDEAGASRNSYPAGSQHISLLVGNDNENSFARIGIVANRQLIHRWRSVQTYQGRVATDEQLSRMDEGVRVLLSADGNAQTSYGLAYAMASGRCCRCGRTLTVPASLHAGMGPECRSRG